MKSAPCATTKSSSGRWSRRCPKGTGHSPRQRSSRPCGKSPDSRERERRPVGKPDGKEDPPAYYENDSVWFKPEFNSHWYRGLVEDVGRWFLWVRKLGETHLY